jgi:parallel beta-helix repeat protein
MLVFLAGVVCVMSAGVGVAAVITVDNSGGANFMKIQDAIDYASYGDTILVSGGISSRLTYYENVVVDKQLILKGLDAGNGKPIVDANGMYSAIKINADGVLLEGFTTMNAANYFDYSGIYVESNNNIIRNNTASDNRIGINVYNRNNNTLIFNNVTNNTDYGIFIGLSNAAWSDNNYNTINFNNASKNRVGIYIKSSNNNSLSYNNASNNIFGIWLEQSSNNTLSGNIVTNNSVKGIYLDGGSDYSRIYNTNLDSNIISNNSEGIYIYFSTNSKLTNNIMSNNKYNFYLTGDKLSYDNQIEKSNLIDGKQIYYLNGAADIAYNSPSNLGTFYCINCINITLENLKLSVNGSIILFYNTTQSQIISTNASNNTHGIKLQSSSNTIIEDNNVPNIDLYYSFNNTLIKNNITFNGLKNNYGGLTTGIYLFDSSNNKLIENNAFNNNYGIDLSGGNNNSLIQNKFSNNSIGVLLRSWNENNNITLNEIINNSNGIYLNYQNHYNNFISNNISNNIEGIHIGTVGTNYYINNHDNSFSNNYIKSNSNYGIYIWYPGNNYIYNNYFNNSNNFYLLYSINSNYWNTTKKPGTNIVGGPYIGGNFWANPGGTGFSQNCMDEDGDGICELPYTFDSYNIDYLPLSMNFNIDTISPASVTNLINTSYAKNYINWTWTNPPDPDFNHTELYLNGTFITNIPAPQNYYNATGLLPDTSYELSTRTVDTSGNINQTWKNATASTLPLSDTTPPTVTNPTSGHEIPDDTDNEPLWGETAQLNVTVTDDSGVAGVTVNLSEIGGSAAKPMTNIGDNIWYTTTNASGGTLPKLYYLTINATGISGNSNTSVAIPLKVMKNGDTTGNGVVNIGDTLRCANNVSFPGNPAYTLSSPYVTDVTGNSVINIGDCLRLANNVSFLGNPLYILK